MKTVQFSLPPKWLIDQYEAKRDTEIRKKQKEVQKLLHSMADNKEGRKKLKRNINPNSLKNLKHVNDRKDIDKPSIDHR